MDEETVADAMGNNEALPEDVQDKLSKIFEKYQQLSDEEKEEFHKGAYDVLTESIHKFVGNTFLPTWLVPYQSLILFLFAVSIVAFLLALVARILYRGTKERESRKEEKRRLKEQKAKKKKKN